MQETPHIREVVVSSAKVSDVAASNLKNPQWHTEGPPLSFAVVYKPQPNTFQIWKWDISPDVEPPFIFPFSQSQILNSLAQVKIRHSPPSRLSTKINSSHDWQKCPFLCLSLLLSSPPSVCWAAVCRGTPLEHHHLCAFPCERRVCRRNQGKHTKYTIKKSNFPARTHQQTHSLHYFWTTSISVDPENWHTLIWLPFISCAFICKMGKKRHETLSPRTAITERNDFLFQLQLSSSPSTHHFHRHHAYISWKLIACRADC